MPCSNCNDNSPLIFDIQSFVNSTCTSSGDSCMPSNLICYTGSNLPCSLINNGDTLEDALTKIDSKICSISGNYSTYQKHCLPSIYGSAINDESTFVDAITSYLCTTASTVSNFISNTFVTYQASVTSQFTAVNNPAITCASASVTSVDTLNTILAKYCTKFTSLDSAINLTGIDFGSCFTVVDPITNVRDGFTEVLSQICQLKTSVDGGTVLPTFNNTGSCLASPSTTDSLISTIGKIKTKLCSLPTWISTNVTWGCVGSPTSTTSIEEGIQRIISKVNYMLPKVVTFGDGFTTSPVDVGDACQGINVSLDGITDRLVASNSSDDSPGTLDTKLSGDGITIDSTTTAGLVILRNDHKVLSSSSDTIPSYLINKLSGSTSSGITITPTYNTTTKQVDLILTVDNNAICNLVAACANSVPCSGYTITPLGSSLLSYTDCNGTQVGPITISGVTNICAKINTVYSPNSTIVITGPCPPEDVPLFSLFNNSVDIVVSDVVTGGLRFYTISAGSYPTSAGEFVTGVGNTSGIVSVLTSSGTGIATLFKNDILQQVINISGSGTFNFSAVTYGAGDDLKVIINPVDLFSVENNSTVTTITGVNDTMGAFFTVDSGAFPMAPGAILSGNGTSSNPVSVHVTYTGTSNRWLALYKNDILIQVIVMTGTNVYTFSSHMFVPGDTMKITTSDTNPSS